jgi:Tfp pilus assembly protein PilX
MNTHLRRALHQLRHSERGIALPMALMLTVIAMGFAAVPIIAAVGSQEGDSRSQSGNEALAAAEAGAELAVLRQSKMLTETTASTAPSCVTGSTLETTGGGAGWCSKYPATAETFGNAKFQYRVRPCYSGTASACSTVQTPESCLASEKKDLVQVVSTGFAVVGGHEVTRRVQLAACAKAVNPALVTKEEELIAEQNEKTTHSVEVSSAEKRLKEKEEQIEKYKTEPGAYEEVPGKQETLPPPNVWAAGQVIGLEYVKMNNNAQVLNGGVGSNGAISAIGSANVCGTVSLGGSGASFTTDSSTSASAPSGCAAGRTVTKSTEKFAYPAVTLPSDIATNNSNSRICAETACHEGADPVGSGVYQRGNISWNASNKSLSINYSQLTLEGTAPYYLCQLILAGGSSLYSSTGHGIKIYFAPPSACPGLNGAAQLQIANGTYVYGDGAQGPLFLFVGSTTAGLSKIELAGGSRSQQFVIYGPYSQVNGSNGIVMTGAIVGNTVELAGGAKINEGGAFTPPSAETFLPTETRTGTSTKAPGKTLKELEAQKTKIEEEITADKKKVTEDETKIKVKEEEITKVRSEGGAAAQPLSRKSFIQCSAAPPATTESPDKGC